MGVMNVKMGTRSFGETQGTTTPQQNISNTLSATDSAKMNNEDVGSTLNKLADPNWVDPSKKMRAVGNDKMDKDAFFKLMLAQMKQQDPTNPLKSHEMAAQLATFSQLEQMQNINSTLTEMKNGQKPAEQFQTLTLIGKAVSGDSGKVVHTAADKEHDFRFTLPLDAAETTIKVVNDDGEVVRTYNLKALKKGDNKITWNSVDDKGNKVRPGEFRFDVESKDAGGKKVAVKTDFDGVITGVNYTPEGPVLLVGNQTIRLRDVKKITDPSLLKNDQNLKDVTTQDLKNNLNTGENVKEGISGATGAASTAGKTATADPNAKSKIMENVGLSRDMMTKLAKETKP